jgi:hypothetical protein
MTHIFYLIIIVLTGLGSSIATYYAPQIISRYKQYKTRKSKHNMMGYRLEVLETQMHLLDKMIKEEVERQLKDIIND